MAIVKACLHHSPERPHTPSCTVMGHLLASHLTRPLLVYLELINLHHRTSRLIPHIPILLAPPAHQVLHLQDTLYILHTTPILSLTPLLNNLSPVQVRPRTYTRPVRVLRPLHSRQL